MGWIKRCLFKLMELGLGLSPYFRLDTLDPAFINFRLSAAEADRVRADLPPGFTLDPIRFCQSDAEPAYWISYNLYKLEYPKPELKQIRKARCEINTFVRDASGRRGIYVFSGSPYVSAETQRTAIGTICDLAERMVIFIYGCGRLVHGLRYGLTDSDLQVNLDEGPNRLVLVLPIPSGPTTDVLSSDYCRYNDVSFFNRGRTYDLVHVDSAFQAARLQQVEVSPESSVRGPFFERAPDKIYVHRGAISYLVRSLNQTEAG